MISAWAMVGFIDDQIKSSCFARFYRNGHVGGVGGEGASAPAGCWRVFFGHLAKKAQMPKKNNQMRKKQKNVHTQGIDLPTHQKEVTAHTSCAISDDIRFLNTI